MNKRKKGKRVVAVIAVVIVIVLLIFLKMKYGTYGRSDFHKILYQTKTEILENRGEPISREVLYGDCEDIVFEDIEYTFISEYPESARITDPNIRFGVLRIGVGSSKREVMLAFGLKDKLLNEKEDVYGFQNGAYRVSFFFDENDKVYKISFGRGA